ncbi:MAG: GGDEF domain-containing protein [Desulfovibrio sp.]|jgi:diguanylate cyclase (GGDEF)-like protein|nr:GGDEF domain-containing protein [Desulfovibrio sp.]
MLQDTTSTVSWGFGLSLQQEERIRSCLGGGFSLSPWSAPNVPSLSALQQEVPCALWLSIQGYRDLASLPDVQVRHLDILTKILLLDEAYSLQDLEDACDAGCAEILRPPLTARRVQAVMRRAMEAQAVHEDMFCMAREALLERELLERKNDILAFLVNFLAKTSDSLDSPQILKNAFIGLNRLFTVHALHAALWHPEGEDAKLPLSLFFSVPETRPSFQAWRGALLERVRAVRGAGCKVMETAFLDLADHKNARSDAFPSDGHLILLPIAAGTQTIGVLLLQTDMERNLGRDQNLALEAALRHLGLLLKNSRRFRMLQDHADYDVLTRVHSRRHLEQHLHLEMERYHRYKTPLSLIMLDIDHFKRINDSRGHAAGDAVLRETAALIMKTIRTADYCARYGGEEFLLLLPHTDNRKAYSLAERLRSRLAAHTFILDGEPLNITVSLGVSTLAPVCAKTGETLISEADAALYEAKSHGRNQTRAFRGASLPFAAVASR